MPDVAPGSALTAVDLFCGVGGLSLGLTQSGFRLLGAVDADPQVLETHKINFPDVPTLPCDLFSASGSVVLKGLGVGEETQVDLLAGGPPCQGFSSGGKRAKKDVRNQGILAFARLVTELRPRYFLMENVRGFLFKDHSYLRRKFRKQLRDAGYSVLPFKLLDASNYGVPQRRKRAFVLGCLETAVRPRYPEPRPGPGPCVLDAISDLRQIDLELAGSGTDEYTGQLGEPTGYAAPLRVGRDGTLVRTLTGCLRSAHSTDVVKRFEATPPGEQEEISRFFRLHWKGVSPTIRAGTGPDHGSHTSPRPIHPEWPRCITVREAARLHSFPDWFAFRGTRWHGFRQIGNSVPPLLARAVAESVIAALTVKQDVRYHA